jgi:hypothetical protein
LLLSGQFFKPYFIILLILISPFIFNAINQAVQYQISYKLTNSNSFDGRYSRLFKLLENWNITQLLFGRGSNFYDSELKQQDLGGFDSFTNIIQRYGILTFLHISICLFINNKFLFALILLLTFLSQPIWSAPFITMFYFSEKKKHTNFIY